MKVFISADIEGVTTTTVWNETEPSHSSYALHAKQMTEEVLACIEGAKKAGATEIFVKDAHGPGTNIDPTRMPSGVTLLRGWSGHPYMMVEGIDKSFDAAMFVGYHSAAGRVGNPMSHTLSPCSCIKINGVPASEFTLFSLACAREGVPTVFLSGDRMLCDDYGDLHPKLVTCPVKDGAGSLTANRSTEETLRSIRELSEKALTQSLEDALIVLPEHFLVEISFRDHTKAHKASFYPGVTKESDRIVTFESDCYYSILQTIGWIA